MERGGGDPKDITVAGGGCGSYRLSNFACTYESSFCKLTTFFFIQKAVLLLTFEVVWENQTGIKQPMKYNFLWKEHAILAKPGLGWCLLETFYFPQSCVV